MPEITRTTPNPSHDVTPPPGASFVDEWQPGPPPCRVVLGATYIVGDIEVQSSVVQFADGAISKPHNAQGVNKTTTPPRCHPPGAWVVDESVNHQEPGR
jgi:hypothetical protein